jgi:hypothetical protein
MAIGMVISIIAATLWEAAYGELGRVLIGLALSIVGTIILAVTDRPPGADEDPR